MKRCKRQAFGVPSTTLQRWRAIGQIRPEAYELLRHGPFRRLRGDAGRSWRNRLRRHMKHYGCTRQDLIKW